jgi:hypothetical protein
MTQSAIDYVNLTRICEFARALHDRHQSGGNDEEIERAFNAACRGIWGYTLDDFTDDDISPKDHACGAYERRGRHKRADQDGMS